MEGHMRADVVRGGVPVSLGATIQRINRILAREQRALRITRDRWRDDLGDFYILDRSQNSVVQTHVDLEVLAREMGLLRPWEKLTD
jgi:hypothetical protein